MKYSASAVIKIDQSTHDRRLYHIAWPISWVKLILHGGSGAFTMPPSAATLYRLSLKIYQAHCPGSCDRMSIKENVHLI